MIFSLISYLSRIRELAEVKEKKKKNHFEDKIQEKKERFLDQLIGLLLVRGRSKDEKSLRDNINRKYLKSCGNIHNSWQSGLLFTWRGFCRCAKGKLSLVTS